MSPFVEGLLCTCLRAYPKRYLDRFESAIVETFHDGYHEAQRRRAFVARSLTGILFWGLVERCRPSFEERRPSRRKRDVPVGLLSEVRFALRAFIKRPGFTAVAVLTLALGIGANTAVFSVVNGVLLKPLPYAESDSLVAVHADWTGTDPGIGSMSYPDLADLESEVDAIETLVGVSSTSMTLTDLGEPIVISFPRVTKGLMDVFGVTPLLGRDIRADEFGAAAPSIVVVSYGFWQNRLGGEKDVLGRTLTLDANPYEIVGVAPPGFDYPDGAELWIPRRLDPEGCGRGCHTFHVVGRLSRGAGLAAARAEADRLAANLETQFPDSNTNKRFLVRSLREATVGDVRAGLFLLLGAVGLLTIIACANVANLLLARASNRRQEIAIRTAVGASRTRLVAQSLVESGLLSLAGAVAGLGLASASLVVMRRLGSEIPRLLEVQIDATVLAFTLGISVAVTFLFGLAPAFALTRSQLRSELSRDPGRRRFRTGLLVSEVALSALLLVGAGLVLRSFYALYAVDVGFDPRNLLRFNLTLPEARYDSLDTVRSFYRELEDRLRELPGIESVGSAWSPPLGRSHATGEVRVNGRPKPPPGHEIEASIHSVGPRWFETMRIPLRRGRMLEPPDDASGEPIALVNEAFVRIVFPREDPLDKLVEVTVDVGYGSPEFRIVGVVSDVRSRTIVENPEPQIYVPHGVFGPESLTVTLRLVPGAPPVLPAARTILEGMDSDVPMYRVETVEEAVGRNVAPTRFYLVLIGAFAVLASLLAAVGLYGVVSYNAADRTGELGIRIALGARRERILRMVLLQGMVPALAGLALGLAGAFGSARVLKAILYGVEPRDPGVYAGAAALLLVTALLATLIPAHRASRVDPLIALRQT
ncbi:MAG TPA: ABC transporter permease [Vicinamibacteria bacterium]|nr:ABC transporter permease [Vicinamibacteria bacterium]